MEVASPPKRMTRARAAAKDAANANANASKDAAAATSTVASTKSAKTTSTTTTTTTTAARPTTTTRTATKRKTRADDTEDEDNHQTDAEQQGTMNKPARTRGRPKKIAESQPEQESAPKSEASIETTSTASTKASRGRAKRIATSTTTTTTPNPEPEKSTRTRTRTRKPTTTTTTTPDEDSDGEPVAKPMTKPTTRPARKTARTRATSTSKSSTSKSAASTTANAISTEPTPGLKSAISRPASRIGGIAKKSVAFQEPEKENMLPPPPPKTKSKAAEPATGMRAKPVRKPAASARTTRASARTATSSEKRDKSPLSPKKDAENRSLSRDADSDDELATLEKTPLKPLMKSPVKPPSMAKKPDLQLPTKDGEEDVKEASEATSSSVFGSPARRPPSSPFKDTMKSPARKVEAIPSLLFSSNDQETAQSAPKPSILQSPAKRPQLSIKSLQPPSQESNNISRSPIKMSLLQSPAKRPASPFKFQGHSAPMFDNSPDRLFAPTISSAEEKMSNQEVQQPTEQPDAMETEDEIVMNEEVEEDQVEPESPSLLVYPDRLSFPGRLSAVLPRHADPALRNNPIPAKDLEMTLVEPATIEPVEVKEEPVFKAVAEEPEDDPMEVDEVEAKEEDVPNPTQTTPSQSLPKPVANSAFGLRAKDLVDHEASDSEDELASSGKAVSKYQDDTTFTLSAVPATPTPSTYKVSRTMPSSAVKAASRAIRSVSKGSKFGGFAPLAGQLPDWKASSPLKQGTSQQMLSPTLKDEGFSLLKESDTETTKSTPSRGFFDEEMKIRADMENQAAIEAALEAEIDAMYGDPEFDNLPITEEDVLLAYEANEMSLIEEDAISEASQEYGDENAVPIDPVLLGSNAGARRLDPVTPSRPSAPRPFHTISKVPLKPADDSTPRIVKKRSASVSKLPPNDRPGGLFRNATVISYSPTKDSSKMDIDEEDEPQYPPVTPSKSDIWTSMGTPARTPRRDLNTALLRGAVVFVDVHTSDGADASTVFVELLTQMGARCVKSWSWNPTSPNNTDGSAAKVGITHVVYKDGGKRTLEKVRESGGVVQCVGVGWVLDCERENEWLDESPYYVDTSLIPRGGHNRRKSMEPKALANYNGTLVTPIKQTGGSARECQTVPNNHISRRDSTAWMHTPSDHDEDEDAPGEHDWDKEISMLTPVPKTPAPEAVRRFALDVTPDSPSTENSYGDFSPEKELLTRTCPPKSAYADMGEGIIKREKDQGILMRLMAARRKSLQFAPKIASPLSKAWN
ncbi:hypothetical protein F4781DRAFT_231194 [Annulohypoxylon bovei var. microspora]|nr:hypothetical protein F4781DRAFT_231194 [Annulohypoxylon bovei var. microspora]